MLNVCFRLCFFTTGVSLKFTRFIIQLGVKRNYKHGMKIPDKLIYKMKRRDNNLDQKKTMTIQLYGDRSIEGARQAVPIDRALTAGSQWCQFCFLLPSGGDVTWLKESLICSLQHALPGCSGLLSALSLVFSGVETAGVWSEESQSTYARSSNFNPVVKFLKQKVSNSVRRGDLSGAQLPKV